MVATAILGAGALSAGSSIFGASSAANAQEQAANNATNAQLQMFQQTQQNLQPFINKGNKAENMLMGQLPSLTAPITMDQKTLLGTPGYQFNLSQGLKGVQNGATARGLGVSGASMMGAANYATGLADSTYQNQFNNALANKQFTYNSLMGPSTLGANAASGLASAATSTGQSIGSNMIGAGNAQAAADMSMANGVSGGINNALGAYLYASKNGLMGTGGGLF